MSALAGCVILDVEGRVLLLHRNTPRLTQWELPGGKLEAGETPAAAAIREVNEELGIDVTISRELGSKSFDHDGTTWHYTWFLAEAISGTPRPVEEKFDLVEYHEWPELARRADMSVNLKNLSARFPEGIRPQA